MKQILNAILIACLVAGTGEVLAAGKSKIHLDSPNINMSDRNSLQRGAKTFVNYCLSCHSASYMRYEHMSRDLGIDPEVVKSNMLFAGSKIGDLMKASMSEKDAAKFFGAAPPDLSTMTRMKSVDYIYSFLKSFYPDPSTPTGWNNTVFEKTAMPHVLFPLQGEQKVSAVAENEGDKPHLKYEHIGGGSQSPEEFEGTVRDLVNFLVYLGEPAKLKRYNIGFWVMVFLGILLIITWFLKKEYWRDVH